MRPFGPLPVTLDRSAPSSRAKRRTDGPACTAFILASSIGSSDAVGLVAAGAGDGDGAAAAGCAAAAGGGDDAWAGCAAAGCAAGAAGEGAAADSAASSINTSVPSETLSPTLTLISLTTPDFGAGTSIVALSDSSAISGSSALTLSPGLTMISMIGISLKSPISGTLTSITLLIRSA